MSTYSTKKKLKDGRYYTKAELKDMLIKEGIKIGNYNQNKDFYVDLFNTLIRDKHNNLNTNKKENQIESTLRQKRKRFDLPVEIFSQERVLRSGKIITTAKKKVNIIEEQDQEENEDSSHKAGKDVQTNLKYSGFLKKIQKSLSDYRNKSKEILEGGKDLNLKENSIGTKQRTYSDNLIQDSSNNPWTVGKVYDVPNPIIELDEEIDVSKKLVFSDTKNYKDQLKVIASEDADTPLNLNDNEGKLTSANYLNRFNSMNLDNQANAYNRLLNINNTRSPLNLADEIIINKSQYGIRSCNSLDNKINRLNTSHSIVSNRRRSSNRLVKAEIILPTISDFVQDKELKNKFWEKLDSFFTNHEHLFKNLIYITIGCGVIYTFYNHPGIWPTKILSKETFIVLTVVLIAFLIMKKLFLTTYYYPKFAKSSYDTLKTLILNNSKDDPENFLGIFQHSFILDMAISNNISFEKYRKYVLPNLRKLIEEGNEIVDSLVVISEQEQLVWNFRK